MKKKKVAIFFGSKSTEYEVSCVSAANVIENVDMELYEVICVGISKEGIWYRYNGKVENIKNKVWEKDEKNKERIKDLQTFFNYIDVAFPILHGKYGEDGSIQGIFEMFGVSYCGANVISNAICMDKYFSKVLVEREGIKVVDYILYKSDDKDNKINIGHLNFPVIIKPVSQGSSVGIKIANNKEELNAAINYANKYDSKILIEKYIENKKEIECSIIGRNSKTENMIASTPGEIISANKKIYDYDSKYNNISSICSIPAKISDEYIRYIKETSLKISKILDIQGFSRVDFIIDTDTKEIYFNEVNTLPGFTSSSMYPKMLIKDGMTYKQIISKIIECANM